MRLSNVFIRFYKSFNFDYLRKFDDRIGTHPEWEMLGDLWYPCIRIPIDEKITTIVGANESGKTHSLTAVEKGLTGADIRRGDFCRYSQFFAVEQGQMRWPDFGFEWVGVTPEEAGAIALGCKNAPKSFSRFLMFRTERTKLTLYIPSGNGHSAHEVSDPSKVLGLLPTVFRLREDIALPESVPIRFLADDDRSLSGLAAASRRQRVGLIDTIWSFFPSLKSAQTLGQGVQSIVQEVGKFETDDDGASSESQLNGKRAAEQNLARDLIRKVARIDPDALKELGDALRDGRDAFANSMIDHINDVLKARLNFPNWWVQDRQFRLLVSPREYDLVFTIRDRTDTEYAFSERSSGLRYFLSYYIQYLAHERPAGRNEILLMDEPDAFLSSQGQQDLLKIFHAFASPDDQSAPIQVVFVTHSPFLIDKNHADRIRVLEKGAGEEGTRVVRDASRNHYEPLRSAFGSFVGETTFIGNCNLVVEGTADQIILAGAATYLRTRGTSEVETLDLNHITIVPAGGATHVPYLVYLARGRDVEKPAVVVLLDSDLEGNKARKDLERGGPRRKALISPQYVLQVHELCAATPFRGSATTTPVETEDLIPVAICVKAIQFYLREVCASEPGILSRLTDASVSKEATAGQGIFKAIQNCLNVIDPDLHVEKIGFARAVVAVVTELATTHLTDPQAASLLSDFEHNMKAVFRKLRQKQRDAERELISEKVSARVNRAKSSFMQDHRNGARREHVIVLFEEFESALDDSAEADEIRLKIQSLQRDFKINENLTEPVENYSQFCDRLEEVQYAGRIATQVSAMPDTGGRVLQATDSLADIGITAGDKATASVS